MKFVVEQLAKLLNISETKINSPPDSKMGDFSTNIAFEIAKEKGENPTITAITLISKLDIKNTFFERVKAYGPYINFFLNRKKFSDFVLKQILRKKEKYGSKKKIYKKVIVEFLSPNTNKPLHLGHLRNMSLGESVSRIIENQGFNVKRINLYNDRGIHICKSMLAYEKWGKGKKPNKKTDHFVGDYYVMFSNKEKKNAKLLEQAQELLNKWENGDKNVRKLWNKMNKWAFTGHKITMKRFGLKKFDKIYYESDFYDQGKQIVLDGLKNKVFSKEKDGRIYADLGNKSKKYLMRADGTSLYITQDLYLAKLKYKDFKFSKSIYVVASEQDHQFKVLFKLFKMLNYPFADNNYHLSYGMVFLPEGKMKSREGTVIDADNLMDELNNLAKKEIKNRGKRPNNSLCENIGLAALKYYLLKISNKKSITFNPEESISFEGDTGPYLLYSLVRAHKILIKSNEKPNYRINSELFGDIEFNLIKLLSSFPDVLNDASDKYSPHLLCNYAFKLASNFNTFYENCPVIKAETSNLINARLLLVYSFSVVMKKCLYLLGIEDVKKM